MSFLSKNKLLVLISLYLLTIAIILPFTLFRAKTPVQLQQYANATTVLTLSPASTNVASGSTTTFTVNIDPGSNYVSFVTLDITYDPTKLAPVGTNSFMTNPSVFPAVIEGPVFTTGRMRVKVSVGSDPTKAVTSPQTVGTIVLQAIGPTSTEGTRVQFGEANYVLSIAPQDNASDNVLVSTTPATVTITGNQLPTPTGILEGPSVIPTFAANITPTGIGGPPTTFPTLPISPTQDPLATVVPTQPGGEPTPTCTPRPVQCLEEGSNCQIPAGGFCEDVDPTPTHGPTPTTAPISCAKEEVNDIVIALDVSGSMWNGKRIVNAKQSAINFLKVLQENKNNRVALVTYAKTATLENSLTQKYDVVKEKITNAKRAEWTCIKCAIEEADKELSANSRPDANKIVVLLTDGLANSDGIKTDNTSIGESSAKTALEGRKTTNLTLYTIGVENGVNEQFLDQLASSTNGVYYHAKTPVEIDDTFMSIYKKIADAICEVLPMITATPNIPQVDSGFNNVTLIIILLLLLPIILLLGHLLF